MFACWVWFGFQVQVPSPFLTLILNVLGQTGGDREIQSLVMVVGLQLLQLVGGVPVAVLVVPAGLL